LLSYHIGGKISMIKKAAALFSSFLIFCTVLFPIKAQASVFHIDFDTYSKAIELVNLDTGVPVYEKNPNEKCEPASITKIMTYIVAVEHIKDLQGTKITVKQKILDELSGTGSSMSGIQVGDVATAYQLLNCMMVPSGNDAALTLADYVGGGDVQKFVDMMNEKAKELGCTNTHFMNPHGLHDPNHYTTAADIVKITRYAMSLPYFMQICNQLSYTYKPIGGPNTGKQTVLSTTNRMLMSSDPKYYYTYAKGIKTGHTDESGYCLVSTASADGYSYLCVALGAPSVDSKGNAITTHGEMLDSAALYRWALRNLELKQAVDSTTILGEVPLKYAWNKDTLQVTAEKSFSCILPKNVQTSSIIVTPNLPESVEAPIKKGQVIGTATVSYANQKLATIKLVAADSVERSEVLHTTDIAKSIVTSTWFLIIAGIVIFLLVVYIVLAIIYNRKRKTLRKVKHYKNM
jgi:serine-type D-Ala-D-Ala carboxypeptidase (penicillin-binding protein 5/6)